MRFSDWTSLDQINQTPPQSGLFQIKMREGLLGYPTGKSAMFYYGYSSDLASGLKKFCKEVLPLFEINANALLVRWMAAEDTEERFRNHLNAFLKNFGTMPLGNEMFLHERSAT